jgi:hypothetical protein
MAAEVKWIDSAILKQLQAIESIDRSKYKPDVLREIASAASASMRDAVVTSNSSQSVIPELPMPLQQVIVVQGKTKQQLKIRGKTYPAGLLTEMVFDATGKVIRGRVELNAPAPTPPGWGKLR